MPKNLTPLQIEKILRKCQKRLHLQDWHIELKVVPEFSDGRVAQCRFHYRNMSAEISILDPKFNKDTTYGMQNVESTIYHELLHCILTPAFDKQPDEDTQEQIIERLAKAYAGI